MLVLKADFDRICYSMGRNIPLKEWVFPDNFAWTEVGRQTFSVQITTRNTHTQLRSKNPTLSALFNQRRKQVFKIEHLELGAYKAHGYNST